MTALRQIREIALFGVQHGAALWRAGRLDRRVWWTAVRGSSRFARAAAAGDVAPATAQAQRLRTCATCRHLHTTAGDAVRARHFCGAPFVDGGLGRPCGCLVAVTFEGEPEAAGKTVVASESCPLQRPLWGPVPVE